MTQQLINTGASPGDGTGDPGRTAWTKANANFTELYSGLGSGYSLRLTSALAAGANNNLTPSGFVSGQPFRAILTAPSGIANVTGFVAGADGQSGIFVNADASNIITLNNQNGGSSAANQFYYFADYTLRCGESLAAVYDATLGFWILRA